VENWARKHVQTSLPMEHDHRKGTYNHPWLPTCVLHTHSMKAGVVVEVVHPYHRHQSARLQGLQLHKRRPPRKISLKLHREAHAYLQNGYSLRSNKQLLFWRWAPKIYGISMRHFRVGHLECFYDGRAKLLENESIQAYRLSTCHRKCSWMNNNNDDLTGTIC
jgi:hypothetical protein